jgi:FlaG/FlaF family flagellin (archaellin)
MTKLRSTVLAVMVVLAAIFASISSASATLTWSPVDSATDCSGNGCLTVYWRMSTNDNVGFKLESVKISASGGALYGGAEGKGLSCWNDQVV